VIEYVKGDATAPQGAGPKIIAHIVNNAGQWGAGFVLAISKRWTQPEKAYRAWSDRTIGDVQMVHAAPDIFVANLCAQDNVSGARPPVRYNALKICLADLREAAKALGASIHMPRIGCGIGGGRWEEIEPIITDELRGLRVVVYDQREGTTPAPDGQVYVCGACGKTCVTR
jgi:O-acetyl-ADP-ribose deacetylase (regulator of RNase III)